MNKLGQTDEGKILTLLKEINKNVDRNYKVIVENGKKIDRNYKKGIELSLKIYLND